MGQNLKGVFPTSGVNGSRSVTPWKNLVSWKICVFEDEPANGLKTDGFSGKTILTPNNWMEVKLGVQ